MTKLNIKLFLSISITVIFVLILSLIINNLFVDKYYLYEKKHLINNIEKKLNLYNENNIDSFIKEAEKKYNIIITYIKADSYSESINDNLLWEFNKKGVVLKKFWISKDIFEQLDKKSINKIYNQGKMSYSLLVKFLKKKDYLFTISTPIEHSKETISIVNRFNIILNIFSVFIILILSFILSKNIVRPLRQLNKLSKDIALLNFRTEKIKTNDEIEELSENINIMSINLKNTYDENIKRNETLKRFISDASHELKTPISIIKAYSIGIKDDMDDGTYIDTIIEQTDNMTNIIDRILYWAKCEQIKRNIKKVDLKEKLINTLSKYTHIIKEDNINLNIDIKDDNFFINIDDNDINMILDNLITNAIKYTNDKFIGISLLKDKDNICLYIENGVKDISKNNIKDLWKPFYTLESSRNKYLSGTGIGLSIVKSILERYKFKHSVKYLENKIMFFIQF